MTTLIALAACVGALYFGSRRNWMPAAVCALVAVGMIPSTVTAMGLGMIMPIVPIVPIAFVIVGLWWMIGRPRRARG